MQETTPDNHEALSKHFTSGAEGFSNPNSDESKKAEAEVEATDEKAIEAPDVEHPEISYSERLQTLEIDDEIAVQIIDDMCEQGSYFEKVVVRKAREGKEEIIAVLSTRDTRSQAYIVNKVSLEHKNIPMLYNKLMGELQLAASLIFYNGVTYAPLVEIEDQDEFETELLRRVTGFSKLPAPITVVLTRAMGEFDLKVAAVMAPGYEDFF